MKKLNIFITLIIISFGIQARPVKLKLADNSVVTIDSEVLGSQLIKDMTDGADESEDLPIARVNPKLMRGIITLAQNKNNYTLPANLTPQQALNLATEANYLQINSLFINALISFLDNPQSPSDWINGTLDISNQRLFDTPIKQIFPRNDDSIDVRYLQYNRIAPEIKRIPHGNHAYIAPDSSYSWIETHNKIAPDSSDSSYSWIDTYNNGENSFQLYDRNGQPRGNPIPDGNRAFIAPDSSYSWITTHNNTRQRSIQLYDRNGQPISSVIPHGDSAYIAPDSSYSWISTNKNGETSFQLYDRNGQPIGSVIPDGNRAFIAPDSSYSWISTFHYGRSSIQRYDRNGQPIGHVIPDGGVAYIAPDSSYSWIETFHYNTEQSSMQLYVNILNITVGQYLLIEYLNRKDASIDLSKNQAISSAFSSLPEALRNKFINSGKVRQ